MKQLEFKKGWKQMLAYESVLSSIKDIEKRNKKFDNLSNVRQRKEIAIDVLELISSGVIMAKSGNYWSSPLFMAIDNIDNIDNIDAETLQKNALNIDASVYCTVCARGAIMLSGLRFGRSMIKSKHTSSYLVDTEGSEKVESGFTFEMYNSMETVFEGWFPYDEHDYPYKKGSSELLANIFLQVVQTGKFDPENTIDYLKHVLKNNKVKVIL